ncbi:MAG: homocysteine S-methyltransferase family protein [Thermoguttaceae bacterium]
MHPTIAQLTAAGPVLTDGAWGTQLQLRGLPVGACPDAWNLANPEKVEEVARAYVDAGSRLILTNTFGANRFVLARHDLANRVAEVNRRGVEISRRAAAGRAAVFASMGPSGIMLLLGQVGPEDLRAAFAEQANALAEAQADGIVVETMSDPAEAALAVAAAHATGLPVVACMTFGSGAQHDRTMMGTTPEQAAKQLTAAGADVIGANCGLGIASMVDICRRLRTAADVPIWIKANAGLPEIVDGQTTYRQTPAEFAGHVPELLTAGAAFLGGCCGTTPAFIRAVAEQLKR